MNMFCKRCGGSCLWDGEVHVCLLCGREQEDLTPAQERHRVSGEGRYAPANTGKHSSPIYGEILDKAAY